jgi:small subunit ribosomal protein S1
MIKNRDLVYDKAEEMAAKYREQLLAKQQGITIPAEVAPVEGVAEEVAPVEAVVEEEIPPATEIEEEIPAAIES